MAFHNLPTLIRSVFVLQIFIALIACGGGDDSGEDDRPPPESGAYDKAVSDACKRLLACGFYEEEKACLDALNMEERCVLECFAEADCDDILSCRDPKSEKFRSYCGTSADPEATSSPPGPIPADRDEEVESEGETITEDLYACLTKHCASYADVCCLDQTCALLYKCCEDCLDSVCRDRCFADTPGGREIFELLDRCLTVNCGAVWYGGEDVDGGPVDQTQILQLGV